MYCKMCYKEFTPSTSTVCCGDKCRLENERQNRRRSWHRRKHTLNRYDENIRLKMWRIRKRIINGK